MLEPDRPVVCHPLPATLTLRFREKERAGLMGNLIARLEVTAADQQKS